MINIIASPYCMEDVLKLKEAGATSIIAGTPFFSVRSVSQFSLNELKQLSTVCVNNALQLYVLVNRFFMEDELTQLSEFLKHLKTMDVKGIYFTDLAVCYEAKKLNMHHLLIYNPDTILTNSKDIQAYLDLGIKMCTISKEITLEDMTTIANRIHGELEIIIHGRLHMLHSKRTLLSNYMEFIGSNEIVGNQKNIYLMEEKRDEKMPVYEDESGTHIFTGFTLASFVEVNDLIDAGIKNLRIESLFSNIDEICTIIKNYQKVIADPQEGIKIYKQYEQEKVDQNITKGFYYKKTGATK